MTAIRPALALAFTLAAGSAVAGEWHATILDFDACAVEEHEIGANLLCEGFRGVTVHVDDFDGRVALGFGNPPKNTDTFGIFNSASDVVLWYAEGDAPPTAALAGYVLSVSESGAPGTWTYRPALVVHQVARDGVPGCAVGVVDPLVNGDAMALARAAGEAAGGSDCEEFPAILGLEEGIAPSFNAWSR